MLKSRRALLTTAALITFLQTQTSYAEEAAEAGVDAGDAIIVTGTRVSGSKAADSAAPISVINSDVLARVGQPNLTQALTQIAPSFSAQSFGGDTANLTLSAKLRGLSPNQTLVLINGKRRHSSANLHVLSGPYQGSAAPDIDLIPSNAIARIEILQDGAAAQYGSDAIAGVVNVILKSDDNGISGGATAGKYYQGGGDTFAQQATLGTKLGDNGFLNISVLHRFHDFSQQGGADRRLATVSGAALPGRPASWTSIPGWPNLNRIVGDAQSWLTTGFVNAGYNFGTLQLYGFGSYSRRVASSFQNYRLPNRIVPAVGAPPFPQGFSPREGLREDDYAGTFGIKGTFGGGGTWDLSTTYGQDVNDISTLDSANASLFLDTGFTPRDFYNGRFKTTQWTSNLDLTYPLELGLAKPATLAAGLEYRKESYTIGRGDAASIYKEGGQSYPGFQPTDAGTNKRNAFSAYLDLNLTPVEGWLIDLAGRYEHFSDFGNSVNTKVTTRYDFSPAFALRGTFSTGFRAPTLAESYYSATNVSPTAAVVQLPANSAAAKLLGFPNLAPEKSTGISAGLVLRPAPRLTITIDAYRTWLRNRIVGTGTILGQSGTTVVNPAVLAAIASHGNVLDPTVTFVGVSVFANGADTRTSGVEFAASYPTDVSFGRIDWTLNGAFNATKVTKNKLGGTLFGVDAISNLQTAAPAYKIGLGALLTSGAFSLNLRETIYGPASNFTSPDSTNFYKQRVATAAITDLEASYKILAGLELSVGANNLFNKRPQAVSIIPGTATATSAGTLVTGGNVLNAPITISPYGINGGYYYARLSVRF